MARPVGGLLLGESSVEGALWFDQSERTPFLDKDKGRLKAQFVGLVPFGEILTDGALWLDQSGRYPFARF